MSGFACWEISPSSTRAPATSRPKANRPLAAIPTAGPGRTAAGSRCRRMWRGEASRRPGVRRDDNSGIKHDDAAHGLAGLHRGKAFVDLGELELGRDPVLQMQLPSHVELDQAGHVDAEMVRTHR